MRLKEGFCEGAVAFSGIYMAFQDYLGLEGYIAYLRTAWIDLPWTVGAIIVVLAVMRAFVSEKPLEKK